MRDEGGPRGRGDQPRRVYISGALTGVTDPEAARARYELMAELCTTSGLEPYLPHRHTDPEHHPDVSPVGVYQRDLLALSRSDVLLADLSAPSLGVGAEVAIAAERHLRIVAVYPPGVAVSRFVIGLVRSSSGREVVAGAQDLERKLGEVLRHLMKR